MKHTASLLLFCGFLFNGLCAYPQTASEDSLPITTTVEIDGCWQRFNDPLLDSLINLAENNNYDLRSAVLRMETASKEVSLARSGYYPTVEVSGGWNRTGNAGAIAGKDVKSTTTSYFDLGLSANWEIDLFGRIAAQTKSARAGLDYSKADRDAVLLSLCASLTKSYISLRTYQAQYEVAMNHIASQEKVVKITEARFEAGIGDMLEVTQARLVLSSTKATIPGLESMIKTTANSIAVLCGEYPANLTPTLLTPRSLPSLPPVPPEGIEADLVRRRPDIREAEYQVAQLAAQAGVAQKDFLPTLTIAGSIATSSHDAKGLFGKHSLGYSVAPTLTWTVFDGMARNIRLAEAKLKMQESVEQYNSTVVNAVCEVENALEHIDSAIKEANIEEETAKLSHKSLSLSVDLYKRGLTPFSNVVDAQMNYLTYQNSYITSKADALTSMVSLYQALGGGY
ncbi:MAG: efflux transporter outer membrane subunit [Bacteroidales bacterium]|nr:efflux transporter outer membrane subunit [Bacteroidales bacterium]